MSRKMKQSPSLQSRLDNIYDEAAGIEKPVVNHNPIEQVIKLAYIPGTVLIHPEYSKIVEVITHPELVTSVPVAKSIFADTSMGCMTIGTPSKEKPLTKELMQEMWDEIGKWGISSTGCATKGHYCNICGNASCECMENK